MFLTIYSIYCLSNNMVIYGELFDLQDRLPDNRIFLYYIYAHHTLWITVRVDGRGERLID